MYIDTEAAEDTVVSMPAEAATEVGAEDIRRMDEGMEMLGRLLIAVALVAACLGAAGLAAWAVR